MATSSPLLERASGVHVTARLLDKEVVNVNRKRYKPATKKTSIYLSKSAQACKKCNRQPILGRSGLCKKHRKERYRLLKRAKITERPRDWNKLLAFDGLTVYAGL